MEKSVKKLLSDVVRPPPWIQILLLPAWPIIWAIGLDQIMQRKEKKK